MKGDLCRPFLGGIELFNAGAFWEAHEAWEEIWLHDRSESRLFLQGLIQLAAAYHHVRRGTFRGAVRLFAAAFAKMERFPPLYLGVERDALLTAARQHQRWTSAQLARGAGKAIESLRQQHYPQITLTPDWESRVEQAIGQTS